MREDAREDLSRFIGLIMPDIRPAVHHKLLIAKLEAVARGKIKRLMIFLPPGAAKSTYASILFPPWYMGRHPTHPVIAASHAKELAERFGRRVRNIVDSPIYRDIFGFGLGEESGAAGRWETARGGEYYAVGVDGSVTGRRAALGIIDDPVKGRAEADSPTIRNHAWEWYKSDFWTRLLPDAGVIYIGTRWHDDDLASRLLEEQKAGGEQWEVVSIPAVAVEGRALRQLRCDWPAGQFVFQTERGGPMTPAGFRKTLAAIGKAAGFDWLVHPHSLRHSTGYALANKGVDTRTLQHYLGHRCIEHTVRYSELAADRFAGLWLD